MKNVFVYCEVENQKVAEISQELLSAGKKLAVKLGCELEAMIFGKDLNNILIKFHHMVWTGYLLLMMRG